jgi:DNA gyrase subunit A
MIALVDGIQPRLLTLKTILEEYIKHRQVVVRRRTEFDLQKNKDRAHILEGLKMALDQIELVIKTIRASKDKTEAKVNLIKNFKFSEIQTQAILEMRLQQLANLERKAIEMELEEKLKIIAELEAILKDEKKILVIIKNEVEEIRQNFGDTRKTTIIATGVKEFKMEDLIPNEGTVVMITEGGYIKRLPPDTFKAQHRGGKGVVGTNTKTEDEDSVIDLFMTNTHDYLLFFTSRGRVFQLKAYDVPVGSRTAKGQALVNFLELAPNEKVASVLSMDDMSKYKHLIMVTNKGTIKKTEIKDFENVRRTGIIALKLKSDDMLEWVKPTTGKNDILIVTRDGQAIRFPEKQVRPMGRTASGVKAMKLKSNDTVVGMAIIDNDAAKLGILELLVISEKGLGKKTDVEEYKSQNRGGSGIKTMQITDKTGDLVSARVLNKEDEEDIMLMSKHGQVVRTPLKSIPNLGRATQGVKVMRFKENDDVVSSMAVLPKDLSQDGE